MKRTGFKIYNGIKLKSLHISTLEKNKNYRCLIYSYLYILTLNIYVGTQ